MNRDEPPTWIDGVPCDSVVDRLAVLADDLDAPKVLPANSNVLTISELGPLGIFGTS